MLGRYLAIGAAPQVRVWQAPFPLDLRRTLSVHRRGGRDPAFWVEATGAVWRTSLTPQGPATIRLQAVTSSGTGTGARADAGTRGDAGTGAEAASPEGSDLPGPQVWARAWGPGAGWLLAAVPAMLGAGDDPAGFRPLHPLLRRMARRHPGLRIGCSGRVLEALVPAVLEQKVLTTEAKRSWRRLLLRYGGPAPGPAPPGMRVFPLPRVWARIPSWEWHRAGVEAVRARTIIGAARVAGRLEEIAGLTAAEADRRLQSLPGIGPWTSAETRQRACGDPDAVSIGDLHLPGMVGWALAGRPVDDAGMLGLLAPYPGHRHRAAWLVSLSGAHPPRRVPRPAVRDYSAF